MQPSPARHQTLWSNIFASGVLKRASAIFSDIAIPTALPMPCPRGPVVVSTPSVSPYSGCPGVFEPFALNFFKSSIERLYPDMCSQEYRNILPWPALKINLSRLGHWGRAGSHFKISPKRTAPISAQPSGSPRCPDERAAIASIANPLDSFAAFCRMISLSIFIFSLKNTFGELIFNVFFLAF